MIRTECEVCEHRYYGDKHCSRDEDMKDRSYIDYVYKKKAKELHPDVEGGDVEKFKELKEAHDQIIKELS